MNVSREVETDILNAIREVYTRSRMERPIIDRAVINREMLEYSHKYPAIKNSSLSERRRQIACVCDARFQPFASTRQNCSWIITREGLL